jgi:peptidoglycan/xylan/chitin deacetylase (PgdA/CDA1 family)
MNTTKSVIERPPVSRSDDPAGEAQCLVVMYHYVRDRETLPRPGLPTVPLGLRALDTREFRIQLDRLGRSMEPIDWPTFYAWTCGRGSIPRRSFLLTFDDGLVDHAVTVLPILRERGLRGVFFVPGAVLTSQRLLPAHALHVLLSVLDAQTLEQDFLSWVHDHKSGGKDWAAAMDPAAAQSIYYYETPDRARLKYLLTQVLPITLRNEAVMAIFERHIGSPTRWALHWYLTWDDLAGMQTAGHTIGGHAFAHEPYNRLTPAQRRDDLRRVAAVLRSGLGPDRRPFSYPYGRWDQDAGEACRDAGFVHGFTTERRLVRRSDSAFSLPRVDTVEVEAVLGQEVPCPQT